MTQIDGESTQGHYGASASNYCTVLSLANYLEDKHADGRFAAALKLQDLLSQLIFMFRVGWRWKSDQPTLWVIDEHGNRRRGHDVYMDSTKPSAASFLLRNRRTLHFPHPDIANTAGENSGAWHQWLVSSVRVAIYSRLESTTNPRPLKSSKCTATSNTF